MTQPIGHHIERTLAEVGTHVRLGAFVDTVMARCAKDEADERARFERDEDAAYDQAVEDAMLDVLERERDELARDVGRAAAGVVEQTWGRTARAVGLDLALDSGAVCDALGERLVNELRRYGLRVVRGPA